MKIALAQHRVEAGTVEGNVERATAMIERAADRGAALVALPELFATGYFAFDAYARTAESLTGPTLTRLRETAIDHDVALLAGSIVEDLAASHEAGIETPATAGYANTSVLFDSDGQRRSVYRKHHLFGYGSAEQDLLEPGERLQTADVGGFTVGVTTCYDLRFPELYRELADRGVTLVLVPSAWPYPRVEHWSVLPKARAVENLTYVAAVNGVGTFDDEALLGRSTVYDPWGTPIASTGDEPALVTADLDPDRVAAVRESFPALDDRRQP
ncbi:carbon-nitrogen family hydrolase [Halomicrobium sp. IBSBa]|uniref:carbon-nitrogen family hydrolase n=1 Tax=unclassified Halomicrobium TaxID=2610901 RepID=UPI001ABF379F|nr:carbon-nitrogen family hydrolase [Halomicrobium sp. IBSBa]MBO4248341.1 carbon-nitrogen family hydrolase [Halomicrobium sp. IBSBa]